MIVTCIDPEMLSLSLRISCRFFVPKMFLSVVCANNLGKRRKKYIQEKILCPICVEIDYPL